MWMTDSVYTQTKIDTNTMGSISSAWTEETEFLCDVQDINKEKVAQEWGLTDANIWKQVFAPKDSTFTEGLQVKFDSDQYLVRVVKDYGKINTSNHIFMIMNKVVE